MPLTIKEPFRTLYGASEGALYKRRQRDAGDRGVASATQIARLAGPIVLTLAASVTYSFWGADWFWQGVLSAILRRPWGVLWQEVLDAGQFIDHRIAWKPITCFSPNHKQLLLLWYLVSFLMFKLYFHELCIALCVWASSCPRNAWLWRRSVHPHFDSAAISYVKRTRSHAMRVSFLERPSEVLFTAL